MGWKFHENGSFYWKNQPGINRIYFPICNEAGMMSNTTCRLNGDAKIGQNEFLYLPVSIEDLHNNRSSRNFWIYTQEHGCFSLTGVSAKQCSEQFDADILREVTGDFLNYKLTYKDSTRGFKAEILLFCPNTLDKVEIMKVVYTNISNRTQFIVPTSGIPIFGRSADNLRDHRHATSMMHRMKLYDYGLSVKPEIHHDERGHEPNHTYYFVVGAEGDGSKPVGQFPTVKEFIGDGGSFDWPYAVVKNIRPYETPPYRRDGRESVGALRFAEKEIAPGESAEYILISGVTEDEETIAGCIKRYGSADKVEKALEENRKYWRNKAENVKISTADDRFDKWISWVEIQPILRKIYGCSFLPYHDYGRGGRGWRDLWQDYLALILQDPNCAREVLISNYAGIRLDGSNATIILSGAAGFVADRNKVSRVWMDHGAWPFFTTKLYIEESGDTDILWEENAYWKDGQIRRAKKKDGSWSADYGTKQKDSNGKVCKGTVLEHILLQHLICFYNVGEHNNIRLEDGDWNDQLDMASEKGESVPFTAFYGKNLIELASLLQYCHDNKGLRTIWIFKEMLTLTNLRSPLDYGSYQQKNTRLEQYFNEIEEGFSGEKVSIDVISLCNDLREKGNWLLKQVAEKEWLITKDGCYLNGYYNNDGEAVDGEKEDGIHMTLTAQVFGIMSGALDKKKTAAACAAVNKILIDAASGGIRLTTPLGKNTWNFGRGFALVYGEKETGGMFSHMAVMYANALYQSGFVREGYEVIDRIYNMCCTSDTSLIYPGIPEYISHEGIGRYHYVTGAASWMMLTIQSQVFGAHGQKGNLILEPKLVREQFKDRKAEIRFVFRSKQIILEYQNPKDLDYGEYKIGRVLINGEDLKTATSEKVILEYEVLRRECVVIIAELIS